MYFPELNKLREANPTLGGVVDALDRYLGELKGEARFHITASGVAKAIGARRDVVIGLLMAAANLGVLRLKFRVSCPVLGGGIRDFDDISQIPDRVNCDLCGQEHIVTADDVEYFFEVKNQAVGTTASSS